MTSIQELRRMSVKPGGGSARPRSKYNAPDRVDGRYRRGNRRWSSFDRKQKQERKPKHVDPQFWTTTVTVTGGGGGCSGGGGGGTTYTYSCSCPDKSKQSTASFYGADYVAGPTQYTPRVFKVDSYIHYRSDYVRFHRGLALLSLVQFVGIQAPSTYVYRFPTDRIEKYNRSWVGTQAGVPSGGYCKHIWAVILYRADPYTEPTTFPDYYYLEDTQNGMEDL